MISALFNTTLASTSALRCCCGRRCGHRHATGGWLHFEWRAAGHDLRGHFQRRAWFTVIVIARVGPHVGSHLMLLLTETSLLLHQHHVFVRPFNRLAVLNVDSVHACASSILLVLCLCRVEIDLTWIVGFEGALIESGVGAILDFCCVIRHGSCHACALRGTRYTGLAFRRLFAWCKQAKTFENVRWDVERVKFWLQELRIYR